MAFGNTSSNARSFGPNAKLYYASIKQKEGGNFLPAPVFRIQRKKAGAEKDYEDVDPAAKFLSGNLIEIRTKEVKSAKDNKTYYSVRATLVDKDDVVFLTLNHDNLGWNIMNSFCALKSFDNLEMGLYQSKPKAGQTKTFPSVATRQKGELVKGLYTNDQLPAVPKTEVDGNMISNKSERRAFFIKKMNELAERVKAANPTASTEAPSAGAVSDDTSAPDDTGSAPDEDVPF